MKKLIAIILITTLLSSCKDEKQQKKDNLRAMNERLKEQKAVLNKLRANEPATYDTVYFSSLTKQGVVIDKLADSIKNLEYEIEHY